jgi:uncharacterized protein YecT (DUF1311 family)
MTISRFSLLFLCLFTPGSMSAAVKHAPHTEGAGECGNIDPFAVRKCVGARIERKEQLMSRRLLQARKAVAQDFARYGKNDVRTDPKYLDASQATWKRYVENNCTVIAAYGGGSNSSISDREMYCYEQELDRRTQFLQDVANGTGAVDLVG